jgi:hypothetical protein
MQHLTMSAATATANTGQISGWRMRRARNGRKAMNKKFEFTGETKVILGRHTLHRIRALISFGKVEAGELGVHRFL